MSWLFDGEHEINLKLERGSSFGLTKRSMALWRTSRWARCAMAGVEPAEIRLLRKEGGDIIPGCDVILFGKAERLSLCEWNRAKNASSLFYLPLDGKLSGPGCTLHVHEWADPDFIGAILTHILAREGIPLMSWEDVEEWQRKLASALLKALPRSWRASWRKSDAFQFGNCQTLLVRGIASFNSSFPPTTLTSVH